MDSNKESKGRSGQGQNNFTSLQQQMALAAQFGLTPGLFDPSMLAAMGAADLDTQRMLSMQAAGGFPFLDPTAALHAFGSLGGLPSTSVPPSMIPGNMGSAEWMTMAQQAQLLTALGGGMPPAMLSQMYAGSALLGAGSSSNLLDSKPGSISSKGNPEMSGVKRPHSHSPAQISKDGSRPNSNASASRMTPSGLMSPGPSRSASKQKPQTSLNHISSGKSAKNSNSKSEAYTKPQTETDQLMQREMMRQFEQQFMLQRLQLKQQEDQIQAALSAIKPPDNRTHESSRRLQGENTSQSDKIQEHMSRSIYQHLLGANANNLPGMPSTMNAYLGSEAALGQMMGLSQPLLPPISNNRKDQSARCSPRQSHSKSSQLPISSDRKSESRKSHSTSDGNPHGETSSKSSFPGRIFGNPNSVPLTGDPSTDMLLAAMYDQLTQRGFDRSSSKPTAPPGVQTELLSHRGAAPGGGLPSIKREPGSSGSGLHSNEKDSKSNGDSGERRRKQANPTSLSNALSSVSPFSNDEIEVASASKFNQEKPISLVKEKFPSHSSQNLIKRETENRESRVTSSPPIKQTNQICNDVNETPKSLHPTPHGCDLNEKELMLTLQAISGQKESFDIPQSLEGLDKALLSAYSKLLSNSQPTDVNKINDFLAQSVATQMQRLQMQKVNLTRELEKLNKGEVNPSLSSHNKTERSHSGESSGSGRAKDDSSFLKMIKTEIKNHDGVPDELSSEQPRSRKRHASEEKELMEPLEDGWKRETRFRYFGGHLHGEVCYVSPEIKKLRNHSEVTKHLEETEVKKLNRTNFSFNPRLKIGVFFEQLDDSNQWKKLSNDEVAQKMEILDQENVASNRLTSNTNHAAISSNRHRRRNKMLNRSSGLYNRGETTKHALEEKLRKESEHRTLLKQAAELKARQREQEKTQAKILRQQKVEQQRIEREIRERQLLEERQKVEAARHMEREQRRQHIILLKALEAKKRAEERDRRREEIRLERMSMREKKLEQRRLALKLARELKMPVEDRCLNNHQPMPSLTPLQGTSSQTSQWSQLSGSATADVIMVLEFLHTFKEAILIDESVIPTFEQLQRGLLNDPEHIGSLVQLTMAMLHQCLCDPGVPAQGPWLHCLIGVKVTDLDVCKGNYSEILRLFIWGRNGRKNEITALLETEPFPSLSCDQKAGVLAFLVNELVCSQPVCTEIDKHLENLATLRRHKWIVEGKIRQARVEQANDGSDGSSTSPMKPRSKVKNAADEDDDDKAGKDDDANTGESKPVCRSNTLMERKMKKLTTEHQSFNERLYLSSKPLRSLEIGQDRHKRRYWVLSHVGGIYVEGLESGWWHDDDEEDKIDEMKEEDDIKEEPVIDATEKKPVSLVKDEQTDKELSAHEGNRTPHNLPAADPNATSAIKCLDGVGRAGDVTTSRSASTCKEMESTSVIQLDNVLEPTLISSVSNSRSACDELSSVQHTTLPATSLSFSSIHLPQHLPTSVDCSNSSFNLPSALITNMSTLVPENLASSSNMAQSATSLTSLSFATDDPRKPSFVQLSTDGNLGSVSEKNDLTPHIQSHVAAIVQTPDTSSEPSMLSSATDSNTSNSSSLTTNTATPSTDATKFQQNPPNLSNEPAIIHSTSVSTTYATLKSTVTSTNTTNSIQNPLNFSKLATMMEGKRGAETSSNHKHEDSVVAAARAIAAKAVASTSHLLFPESNVQKSGAFQEESDNKLNPTLSKESNQTHQTPLTCNGVESVFENTPGLGKHMAKALQSIGMAAGDLSQQQLMALMHIKDNHQMAPNSSKPEPMKNTSVEVETCTQETHLKPNVNQDAPIDLSKPPPGGGEVKLKATPTPSSYFTNPTVTFTPASIPTIRQPVFSHKLNDSFHLTKLLDRSIKSEFGGHMTAEETLLQQPNDVTNDPPPIPKDVKYGWWKISSETEMDALCDSLHMRGVREKHLHRVISKHRKYCVEAIATANKPEFQFSNGPEASDESKGNSNDEEESDSNRTEKDEESPTNKIVPSSTPDVLESPCETAYLIEMETLKQVEELTARCVSIGILNQAWETLPKASSAQQELSHIPYASADEATKHDWFNPVPHHPDSVLSHAVDLLRKLEQAISRSYLKPPLIRKGGTTEFSNLPSLSESGATDVAAGLRTWRNGVATATSAAQLAMCVSMLESCIAWDRAPKCLIQSEPSPKKKKRNDKRPASKSPGVSSPKKKKSSKVSEDHRDSDSSSSYSRSTNDNAETTPYKSKSSGEKKRNSSNNQNVSSSTSNNDLNYQSDESVLMNSKSDYSAITSEKEIPSCNGEESDHVTGNSMSASHAEESVKKKKKKRKRKNKEKSGKPKKKKSLSSILRVILEELQSHDMAAWFLFPVDTKAVPEYRHIIKKPMDLSTIENRLKKGKYKNEEQFIADVRTIFDNCQIFNEDDSPIGRAGHTLRSFFEKKMSDVKEDLESLERKQEEKSS